MCSSSRSKSPHSLVSVRMIARDSPGAIVGPAINTVKETMDDLHLLPRTASIPHLSKIEPRAVGTPELIHLSNRPDPWAFHESIEPVHRDEPPGYLLFFALLLDFLFGTNRRAAPLCSAR